MSTTDLPVLNHNPGPSPIRPLQADGWVVVSRWLPARHVANSYAYENFTTLAMAVGYHRRIAAGKVRDFGPLGIFAARDGLPVGGSLSMEAIDAVTPEGGGWSYGPRVYEPNSPENKMLREARLDMAAE